MNKSKHEISFGHEADFFISYHFYHKEKGGRETPPAQYYRGDFMYGEDQPEGGIYMIHHEFCDEDGVVLDEETFPVPLSGYAKMWVVVPEMRTKVHCSRIKVGDKYFIMEGSRKVGEGKIERILGLHNNPKK